MSKKLSHCTTPWGPSAPASANVQLWRMHEKAGERGERKLLPDSKLPGGGLCLKKMNEGLQTPIISFIILNLKKITSHGIKCSSCPSVLTSLRDDCQHFCSPESWAESFSLRWAGKAAVISLSSFNTSFTSNPGLDQCPAVQFFLWNTGKKVQPNFWTGFLHNKKKSVLYICERARSQIAGRDIQLGLPLCVIHCDFCYMIQKDIFPWSLMVRVCYRHWSYPNSKQVCLS